MNSSDVSSKWETFKNYKSELRTKDSLFSLARQIGKLNEEDAIKHFVLLDSIVKTPAYKLQFYRAWSIVTLKQGDKEKTRKLRKLGLDIANAEKDPYQEVNYANSLSTFFVNLSNADSASFYAKKIELLAKKHPDVVGRDLWLAYMRNSSVEALLGNVKKEGEFLELAYEEKSKYEIDSNLGFVLYSVADFYRQTEDPVKSSKYAELLIKHYEKRKVNTPDAHFPIEYLLLSVNTPEAVESLKKVIKASDSLKNYNALSASTITLTRAYFKNNEPQKAIPFLKHTIAVLEGAKSPVNGSVEIYLLQQAYAQNNDFENAYYQVLKQKKMEDSLRSAKTLDNIANYEVKYKTQEAHLELEKKNAAQKFLYAIIGSSILLLAVISYFLFKNRKKNLQLSLQKKKLESALSEKEILLKEIHHRVKNNLQVISSLLSLQQRQLNDAEASKALQIGRNRVKAMSLIHENLYQEGNLIGVSIKDYLDKLTQSLLANYKTVDKKINFENSIDDLNLDVDTIIPIGLIINELISNTLKYAFINKDEGAITIQLNKKENELFLAVKDNGDGIPENFNIEESSTLGYRLIKAFSEKLKAKLSIDSSIEGTEVALIIPYLK